MKAQVGLYKFGRHRNHWAIWQKLVAANQSEIAMNLMAAPITINDPDKIPVKRIPILSKMIPAKIKKKQNTFKKYSEAA